MTHANYRSRPHSIFSSGAINSLGPVLVPAGIDQNIEQTMLEAINAVRPSLAPAGLTPLRAQFAGRRQRSALVIACYSPWL